MKYLPSAIELTYSSSLPVSVDEAKTHLRVTGSAEDTIIEAYLRAAIRFVEQYCQMSLLGATVVETYRSFPDDDQPFNLTYAPFSALTSIGYSISTNPATFTNLASSEYVIEKHTASERGVIVPIDGWNATAEPFQVKVTYSTGYANAAAVPANLKIAVFLILADIYENRTDSPSDAVIRASERFMSPYTRFVI